MIEELEMATGDYVWRFTYDPYQTDPQGVREHGLPAPAGAAAARAQWIGVGLE